MKYETYGVPIDQPPLRFRIRFTLERVWRSRSLRWRKSYLTLKKLERDFIAAVDRGVFFGAE